MVVLEIINRDLYRHRLDEDNRGRYFTVYLGHKQYYELRSNVDYPKYINIDHTGSELLFGKIFVILVNAENYYHFAVGQNNIWNHL